MIYLKDYPVNYLKDLFIDQLLDPDYTNYLDEALDVMIKNNYRIYKYNLSIYNDEGFIEGYTSPEAGELQAIYYKDHGINILLELKGVVNNNCSRLKRGFKAY